MFEGAVYAFFNLNFEVPTGPVAVASRLDDGETVSGTWKSSGITVEPDDRIAFVRTLLGKRQLSLTLTFPGVGPTGTTFQVGGLDTALQTLRPHCSW